MQTAKPKHPVKRRAELPSFGVELYPERVLRQMRSEKLTFRVTSREHDILRKMAVAFNTTITNVLSHLVVQAWENMSAGIRRARPDLFVENEEITARPRGEVRPDSVGRRKPRRERSE